MGSYCIVRGLALVFVGTNQTEFLKSLFCKSETSAITIRLANKLLLPDNGKELQFRLTQLRVKTDRSCLFLVYVFLTFSLFD